MKYRTGMIALTLVALCVVMAVPALAGEGEKVAKARQAVEQIYQDCLGRRPSSGEVDNAVNEMLGGRKPKEVRKHVIASAECTQAINKVFKDTINRSASDGEVQKVKGSMVDGKTLVHLKMRLQKKGGL